MTIFKSFLALVLLLSGCASTAPTAPKTINTDSVHVVFDNPVSQSSFTEGVGIATAHGYSFLSYIDSDGFPTHLDKPNHSDTIVLPTINGYIEVGCQYKGIQLTYFNLKGGDTVTFSYNDLKQPFATSKLSEKQTKQYNFANQIERASSLFGFSPKTCMQQFVMIFLELRTDDSVKAYYENEYRSYITNYKKALDSATLSGLLDSVYLNYYQYRYAVESDSSDLSSFNVKSKSGARVLPYNDSLASYISYSKRIAHHSFEAVEANRSLPPLSRRLAMYNILRICNIPGWLYRSPQELEPYYKRAIATTGDSSIVVRIKSDFPEFYASLDGIKSDDLTLRDLSGKLTTLSDVLAHHKGKVAYVDFWASWCSPCVGGMPAGMELRKTYAGRDVVFIYLAKGDAESSWKEAVEQYEIDEYGGENYFVVNNDADFIKKLRISAIPRYVIIDKSGEVVNSLAPRPGSKEIVAELETYLK